jgi:hypothetical protein
MRRTKPLRRLALTLAVGALGLYTGLALAGSASAFDGTCKGTACTGSGTHIFSGTNVCAAGVSRYFVDSFLPAKAQRPHLTSFRVTPSPPCTGATVGGPTVDPWPASTVDPNQRPSGVTAGSGVYRIGWTVRVPAGSKPTGAMKATWILAWTKPDDTTDPSTTDFQPPTFTHDFAVQIKTLPEARVSRAGTLVVKVVVSNNGPDASPGSGARDSGALVFHSLTRFPIVKAPARCIGGKTDVSCGVHKLALNATQSFLFTVRVGTRAPAGAITLWAKINLGACYVEESGCLNNQAYENITTH